MEKLGRLTCMPWPSVAISKLPMDDILTHERKRKWFVWGTLVTCVLSILLVIGMAQSFRGIFAEHATGLAAVAGGVAEAYLTFSVVLVLVIPISVISVLSWWFVCVIS